MDESPAPLSAELQEEPRQDLEPEHAEELERQSAQESSREPETVEGNGRPGGAHPGDGGPCPICGQDMRAQEYQEKLVGVGERTVRGRYWHMRNEHGIWEDYALRDRLA